MAEWLDEVSSQDALATAALTAIAEQGYAIVPRENHTLPMYPKSLSARRLVNEWLASADFASPESGHAGNGAS